MFPYRIKINLVSDLVAGSVVEGTRPTLPIKGVSLLLGNDLAGGKVVADSKARLDSEDPIDGPDVSLSKSKLISEQENEPELAPLFKLVLPPVELDKVPVGYYVRNGVLNM